MNENLVAVSVRLDAVDVDLLDRLGVLEGQNRSSELRGILQQVRPMLLATVEAFEAALRQRDEFTRAAAEAGIAGLEVLVPEVERLKDAYLGALSRLEGEAAAARAAAGDDPDAPASNTGATN